MNKFDEKMFDEKMQEKADLIRAALLAYAKSTLGRERSMCEDLAAQAEDMVEGVR